MSLILFLVAEAIGFLGLYLTWRGVFDLVFAAMLVVVMLTLSFHVLARQPRPDGTSVRMACFAAMLWYATLLSAKLAMEFRSATVTAVASLAFLLVGAVAAFASWSVLERPLDYDVEEAD